MATVPAARLAANLQQVRERIAAATRRGGRAAGAVRLIAVTKTVAAEQIAELYRAGQIEFGESRVQVARDKQTELAGLLPKPALDAMQWHLIGPLQTNKVNLALKLFDCLHGVDSLALAEALGKRVLSAPAGDCRARIEAAAGVEVQKGGAPSWPRIPVYLEVNVSGEASKRGVSVAAARDLAPKIAARPGLILAGLMTMAPYEAAEAELRRIFSTLRILRDELQSGATPSCRELSMGMSDDFETAIEEGATLVRVGRALTA